MSYQATVVRVMLAGPSDVAQPVKQLRLAIEDWNTIHAETRRIMLSPVHWMTHTGPEMGGGPQAVVNRQLRIEDCDILVAVFWTRLGSPTPDAPSGTVDEIRRHMEAGKPTMIYQSSEPVVPNSIDADQYEALQNFLDSLRPQGLVWRFSTLGELRESFSRHLGQRMNEDYPSQGHGVEQPAVREPTRPSISEDAARLLITASSTDDGTIVRLLTMAGTDVSAGGEEFASSAQGAEAARWRAAVDELLRNGLIEDRGGRGELFFVTHAGYQVARELRSS